MMDLQDVDMQAEPVAGDEWDNTVTDLGDLTTPEDATVSGPDSQIPGHIESVEATDLPRDGRKMRRDMTHVEGRRYSQFLLHDIQNELSEGDTLVFVDFPAPSNLSHNVDCFVYAWDSVKFRMDSQKLLDTGSSKLADMLKPTYQFRLQRRRKMVNKLPEGVKYILDLTPPSEGDDLVFQITEVSLTPGVTSWWTAYDKHGVDDYVVLGHDDICSCWKNRDTGLADDIDVTIADNAKANSIRPSYYNAALAKDIETAIAKSLLEYGPKTNTGYLGSFISKKGLASDVLERKSKGILTLEPVPDFRRIPDYCPIRHRVNILRLMCVIAQKQVIIDSAPRVWTLVAVAKILDCTSVVRDLVLQWLMSHNNTVFIEILPEESLQLGVALQLEEVTRAAFRILVNELALEEAAAPNGVPKAAAYTVFGRKRHDPGDDLNNLVQHAARAMVERVSGPLKRLTSKTIYDDLGIVEWKRLKMLTSMLGEHSTDPACCKARDKAASMMVALQNAWETYVVGDAMHQLLDADRLSTIDDHRATYVDIQHFQRFEMIYNQFNHVQKALCPFMYENIGNKWSQQGATFSRKSPHVNLYLMSADLFDLLGEVVNKNPEFRSMPAWEGVLNLKRDEPMMKYNSARHAFDPDWFEGQMKAFLRPFYGNCVRLDFAIPMNMSWHLLLCLTHNEFKFLPLWAGGNNDGTGGVFESTLPPADFGPAGPGPAYHTGITIPSDASSTTGSVSSELRQLRLEGGSTIGPGSVDVQDGISTVFNPNKVVVDDVSIRSESFTDGGSDFANAKHAIPADGQSIADALVDATVLDGTPEPSDAGMVFGPDEDDMDEVMTEIGPEDSRSREATPEYYLSTDLATEPANSQSSKQKDAALADALSASTARSTSSLDDDDDDDLVLV
ncbi:hypothetical protein CSOJ01_03541 [Colletotrichum sojae]|uniref:Uncharacterized protein n=1 Tax=Colletotrichum sojae TaxID=2175907 RepID=A0A8H6JMA8_9PEZI|nr:hypothetical protein CSOJ01_03541 [Colletotrichum sojae]